MTNRNFGVLPNQEKLKSDFLNCLSIQAAFDNALLPACGAFWAKVSSWATVAKKSNSNYRKI